MAYVKRKKNVRMRGSKTHGWGSMKKHRGAGNRGGRGMAGSGKRAKQKRSERIKEYGGLSYFGKKGFNRPQKLIRTIKTINISDLKRFKETTLDLTKLKFNKLLGKGSTKIKYNLTVESCSKSAKEKIESAGGSVKVPEIKK
jgi:large subunit ribosomal protein L15